MQKVSPTQMFLISMVCTIGSSILVIMSSMAQYPKQDGWIAVLIGIGGSVLLMWWYIWLANRFPDQHFVELLRRLLGRWAGSGVAFFWVLVALLVGETGMFAYVGDFVTTQLMPETPISAVIILFSFTIWAGYRYGLLTLARSTELFVPMILLLYLVLVVLSVPAVRSENIEPVLQNRPQDILRAVLMYISYSGFPMIYLLITYPSKVSDARRAARGFLLGVVAGGLVLFILMLLCILVLGVSNLANYRFPGYVLAQKINIANIVTRIEVILSTIWFITLYCKAMLYFYAGVEGLASLFRLEDPRTILMPVLIIIIVFSTVIYPNRTYQLIWDERTWVPLMMTVGLAIPLLLTGAWFLRRNR